MPEFQSPQQDPESADESQPLATDQKKPGSTAPNLSSIELARDQAAERALARAKEYDKISATKKDDWYYVQGEEQFGPVPLEELKAKIADLSTNPPLRLAWHEGMTDWKPVHEISQICGVSPLAATQCFKLPTPARRPGDNG